MSIKDRIEKALFEFENNRIGIEALIGCIELNGQALEAMPYNLIKEIDEIEYQLTQCQIADDEDCEYDIDSTIIFIKGWLNKIPN
jgi:hypothetical protein